MKTIPHLRQLTEEVRAFERSGRYREAFEALAPIWNDISEFPNLTGLDELEQAEGLLRCGVVAGFLGRLDNSMDAQESSKNLLFKARDLFLKLNQTGGVVEAENWLAMAYLRKGEQREAETWIESSFSRDLSANKAARIESFIFYSLILMETGKYEDGLRFLRKVEPFIQSYDDDFFNGLFAANLGIILRNLDRLPEAMQMYSLAKHFYQKMDHVAYLATIENNLAVIYCYEGRYDLAHRAVNAALDLHIEAQDFSRYGFSFDTQASILLKEGRLDEALVSAEKGIEILRKTEFTEFLVETLYTKIKIQAAQNKLADCAITFSELADVIRPLQGTDRLKAKAKEFEKLIRGQMFSGVGLILTEKVIPGEELELELSPSLRNYSHFDAIWLKNDHLSGIGLKKGCLALTVDEKPADGDPVAVMGSANEVMCGYYHAGFGLVTISSDQVELEAFKAEEIKIVGKIVGFAEPHKSKNGKLPVSPVHH
ncbi:MAG: tetratricopeptide repeat protein [Pyrinomonadaceae bacterium]|nr:tetratricopeptide repeat protein [Pyrinomonadaceae bacterium]